MTGPVLYGTGWLIFAAFMLIVEIITLGLTSVWFAIGGLASAICGYVGLNIYVQLIVFMVVSLISVLALRPLAKKRFMTKVIPTNKDSLVGQKTELIEDVDNIKATGLVKLADVEWRVTSENGDTIPKGSLVTIKKVEGSHLIVAKAE